jgi:hypothetical protein
MMLKLRVLFKSGNVFVLQITLSTMSAAELNSTNQTQNKLAIFRSWIKIAIMAFFSDILSK